jgi:hypothetical protein
MVRSAQTMDLSCIKVSTISKQAESSFHLRLITYRCTFGCVQNNFEAYGTSGANHAAILHRYKHCLQMNQNEIPHEPCHLPLPGVSKTIFEPVIRSTQTAHLSCIKISTISKWTETSMHLSLVTYEYRWERPKWFLSPW